MAAILVKGSHSLFSLHFSLASFPQVSLVDIGVDVTRECTGGCKWMDFPLAKALVFWHSSGLTCCTQVESADGFGLHAEMVYTSIHTMVSSGAIDKQD